MDTSRPLGDSPRRSYAAKLERFARFAEPELKKIFADLALPRGGVALDLGCGTGLASAWLEQSFGHSGLVVGVDLSLPHLHAAREHHGTLVQADAGQLGFRNSVLDLVWTCNTVNHLADPVAVLAQLRGMLRGDGVIAVAQSGFLPEMFFAWDAQLDEAVRSACHRYYLERYALDVTHTASMRNLLPQLRAAGFTRVAARTYVIERTQPLSDADRDYFQYAIFEGAWGDKIHPYLDHADVARLRRNCEPTSSEYCLDREDFHHLQTLTVFEGRVK